MGRGTTPQDARGTKDKTDSNTDFKISSKPSFHKHDQPTTDYQDKLLEKQQQRAKLHTSLGRDYEDKDAASTGAFHMKDLAAALNEVEKSGSEDSDSEEIDLYDEDVSLSSFGICSFEEDAERGNIYRFTFTEFMEKLLKQIGEFDMKLPRKRGLPPIVFHEVHQSVRESITEANMQGLKYFGRPPKIIFVLLPNKGEEHVRLEADFHSVIKKTVLDLGITSQCFQASTVLISMQGQSSRLKSTHVMHHNIAMQVIRKLTSQTAGKDA